MTGPNVFGFMAAPDRSASLRAVSLALLKIRALDGMTCDRLGAAIGVCADTVANATNEKALLSFDAIARLLYLFPAESEPIRHLWAPATPPTVDDRLAVIERAVDAIRQEIAR